MADRADAFQDAARLLDEELARLAASADALATRTPVSPRERAKAIKYAVTSFARNVQFVVRVKGQHYSGLSNEALFEVRANEGRDFLERTVQMDQWVRREMLAAFDGFERVPTLDDLRKLHTKLVIQYIANVRFARGRANQDDGFESRQGGKQLRQIRHASSDVLAGRCTNRCAIRRAEVPGDNVPNGNLPTLDTSLLQLPSEVAGGWVRVIKRDFSGFQRLGARCLEQEKKLRLLVAIQRVEPGYSLG